MKNVPSRGFGKCMSIAAVCVTLTSASSFGALIFTDSTGVQPTNVGSVTLTQVNANTVNVLLDLLPTYGVINTGGPHTPFAFNLDAGGTISANFINPAGGAYSFGLFSLNSAGGSATPFGSFGIAIDTTAGNGSGNAFYGDLQFNVIGTSALSISNFVANTDGYFFAADLTNGKNTGSQSWTRPGTPTSSGGGGTVPDGGTTLVSLGIALLGLGSMRKLIAP